MHVCALVTGPGEMGALVENVMKRAVWEATVATIQFFQDVFVEVVSIGGHEGVSNHEA